MVSKELYKEEVKELTGLLRAEWQDIRKIAENQNMDVAKTWLLGFVESEDGAESGLFYSEEKGLVKFEKTLNGLTVKNVSREMIENEFPQVAVLDEIVNYENW